LSIDIVENVSFKIPKGETISIVGKNGSGKSTLIRLIIGLYLSKNGVVSHNGTPINEVETERLFKGNSIILQ